MNKRSSLLSALYAALGCAILAAGCAKPADVPACSADEMCNGACVDKSSDSQNCGACGTTCTGGQVCDNGGCTSSCSGGKAQCGSSCVDTNTSAQHCGNCNTACHNDQTCSAGVCGCAANATLCNGVCKTGGCGTGGTTGGGQGGRGAGGTTGSVGGTTGSVGGTTGSVGGTTGSVGGTTGSIGGTTGSVGGTTGGGLGGSGATPPGYWTYNDWHGCAWTGIDSLTGTPKTTVSPMDFQTHTAGSAYCISGTVRADPMYNGVALMGFNLAEPAAGANCAFQTTIPPVGPPEITLTATGIAVNYSKTLGSTPLRIQLQGKNGATDATDRWCYTLTDPSGPAFAPYNQFYTSCWNVGTTMSPGTAFNPATNPVDAIVFTVPGTTAPTMYNFCVSGFASGNSAADAPGTSSSGPLTGMIGGAGATDLDFQRVKVKAGGKSYIIQNNNWGNPSGTNQTLTYSDNSFTISSTTGNGPGGGVPASFPSIFIGGNGDTQNGAYSTRSDDNLPMQVSQIKNVTTTFRYNRNGGNFNATYDVWFAASPPTARYDDGISGFVMLWFYKPSGNQPIGSIKRTYTDVMGRKWDVWVGPRGGSGSNSSAPVVSYVAQSSITSWVGFDLNAFIADAGQNGIMTSWYLTDVFAGFEIWSGGDTSGLQEQEFTAVATHK